MLKNIIGRKAVRKKKPRLTCSRCFKEVTASDEEVKAAESVYYKHVCKDCKKGYKKKFYNPKDYLRSHEVCP